jgi:site-specific recombinase XerD
MDTITDKFKAYLANTGISKLSLKNYMSDLNNFASWLITYSSKIGANAVSLTEAIPFISKEIADEYKTYLFSSTASKLTINRRLSTLRKFGTFLVEENILDTNFASNLENISVAKKKAKVQIHSKDDLLGFEEYLATQGVAKNTLKNYSADIRQFLAWADEYLPQ